MIDARAAPAGAPRASIPAPRPCSPRSALVSLSRTGSQLNETRAFPDASRRGLLFSPRGRPERASSRERFLASRCDLHAPAPSATVRVFRGVCARQQPGRASVTEKLLSPTKSGCAFSLLTRARCRKQAHRLNAHCKSLQEMGSRSARTRTRTRAEKRAGSGNLARNHQRGGFRVRAPHIRARVTVVSSPSIDPRRLRPPQVSARASVPVDAPPRIRLATRAQEDFAPPLIA